LEKIEYVEDKELYRNSCNKNIEARVYEPTGYTMEHIKEIEAQNRDLRKILEIYKSATGLVIDNTSCQNLP